MVSVLCVLPGFVLSHPPKISFLLSYNSSYTSSLLSIKTNLNSSVHIFCLLHFRILIKPFLLTIISIKSFSNICGATDPFTDHPTAISSPSFIAVSQSVTHNALN